MTHDPTLGDGAGGLAGRFTLRWVPPAGWQQPPDGFVPDLVWRPDRYWPAAPGDWSFWQVVGDASIVEQFHQPLTPQPDPAQPEWVAPPGWPAPPAGWHPSTDWHPDPAWPAPPAGWVFWRQAPEDREAVASTALATRSDQLAQLNQVERLIRPYAEQTDYLAGPEMQQAYAAFKSKTERNQIRESVEQAHALSGEALLATRESLLWLLRNDSPPNPAATGWLQTLFARLDEALEWVRHAKRLAPQEPHDDARLRLLNSFPYGAVDTEAVPLGASSSTLEVVVPPAVRKQAENLAVALMRSFGYPDAHSGDGGDAVAVRASHGVADVAYTSRVIGRPEIQRLAGAAGGMPSAFFSYSGYSGQAEELADERRIALFVVTLPQTVMPWNDHARSMARVS